MQCRPLLTLAISRASRSPCLPEQKSDQRKSLAWLHSWEAAQKFHYGLGGAPIDVRRALLHYRQAAKLGCSVARYPMGTIFEYGHVVQKSMTKARKHFLDGIDHGNYVCHLGLARMSFRSEDFTGAYCSLIYFFIDRGLNFSSELEQILNPMSAIALLVAFNMDAFVLAPAELHDCMRDIHAEVSDELEKFEVHSASVGDSFCESHYICARLWISRLINIVPALN